MATIAISSCNLNKRKHTIGISHSGIIELWGQNLYEEIYREISFYQNSADFKFADAGNSYLKQREDIRQFVKEGIEVLIVFPSNPDSLAEIISEVYDQGIAVIIVDKEIKNARFTTYVGTNDIEIGKDAAQYIAKQSTKAVTVVELKGIYESQTSHLRSSGFYNEIKSQQHPITITQSINCNWDEKKSYAICDSLFSHDIIPDYIFAHNDVMAHGAYLATKIHNINPIIIGIDAVASKGGGIDMILNKSIQATYYNPPGGKEAINIAIKILNHQAVDKYYALESFLVDSTNAHIIKRQHHLLVDQHNRIALQQEKIETQTMIIANQKIIFTLVIFITLLAIVSALLILNAMRQKQKMLNTIKDQNNQIALQVEQQNQLMAELEEKSEQLTEQNAEIEAQRDAIYEKNKELTVYSNKMEQMVDERTHQLQLSVEKAQESDRLKTSFLSNLSHELRTPLNAIIGFSELFVLPDSDYEERVGLQKVMRKNTEELLTLINHIIELSQLTTSQIKLNYKTFNISDLFSDLEQKVKINIEDGLWNPNKETTINFLADTTLPIRGDYDRLQEIMMHLIENAVKFTHQGSIDYGWKYLANEQLVRFFVKDTGTGIHPENYKLIFDRFRKIEDDTLVLYRGVGMGLTISKCLANLMGSTIELSSVYGKGSTFWFDIKISSL